MQRITSIILLLALLMSLTACRNTDVGEITHSTEEATQQTEPSKEGTLEATRESTEASLVTYPLNVKKSYSDYAVNLPEHIYTTTGTENGLAGTIYVIEGTVEKIMVSPDETNTFTYEDALVDTEGGTVTITNLYKTIYNSTLAAYGGATAKATYSDNVEDYIFPEEGTRAQFIVVYMGYSMTSEMPVFILGASPAVFEISEYDDPVASDSPPIETTEPPSEASTEPKKANGIHNNTLVLGNLMFTIPDNFVASSIDENTYLLTSESGDCEIGLFVADVSELDEARVQAYLPMQHGVFVDENVERLEENTLECPVAGFSTVMNYYGTLSEALDFDVNMNVTFTDTWYAYTILFVSDGTSENLNSNVGTFAKFTINAKYTGSPVRFELLQ